MHIVKIRPRTSNILYNPEYRVRDVSLTPAMPEVVDDCVE